MRIQHKTLKAFAGIVWIGVGLMLIGRGLAMIWGERPEADPLKPVNVVIALLIGAYIGFLKGKYVLSRTARRNMRRIRDLDAPRIWNVFSLKFCFVILLMIGLGRLLRAGAERGWIGGYTGVGALYVGIGLALAVAAYAYFAPPHKPLPTRTNNPPKPGQEKTGVLLVNLGTPNSPSTSDVKKFLREFLSDKRVVEVNRCLWAFVLNVIILPFRSPNSAKMYQEIWSDEHGSPLLHFSVLTRDALNKRLEPETPVALGMRYGQPSMNQAIEELSAAGCNVIKLLPMFPQYSNTTVGTVQAEAARLMALRRNQITLQWLPSYTDHPKYIVALAQIAREALGEQDVDLRIFSFHGIPESYVSAGDPYVEECERTAWALAEALDLKRDEWEMVFQSRFGDEPWLQPYLDEFTVAQAASKPNIQIVMPGFATDCLETLEEVAISLRKDFEKAGGNNLIVTPALNDHPAWVEALAAIAATH